MKRLVVCTDGTWNSRDAAREDGAGLTNVAKLERAVAPRDALGNPQHTFYHAGVGVGPWYERMLGGAFGVGLSRNVQACYRWLVELYDPGDQLFLFGFSRGAYTARSLGGLIRNCGLLRREHRGRVEEAYALYRDRRSDAHPSAERSVRFRAAYAHAPRIHCIGVWDTVGALGVPTSGPVGWFTRHRYGFHDVTLSSQVDHAFHALAIDERRKPFAPSLWEVPDADARDAARTQRVEQVWFAGVHSNVGGGYPDCGLSDAALAWMLGRARSAGLAIRPEAEGAIAARCDATLHDSMSAFYRVMGEHRRAVCQERRGKDGRPVHTFEDVHPSVLARHRAVRPPYAPENLRAWLARATRQETAETSPETGAGAIPSYPIRVTDSAVPGAAGPAVADARASDPTPGSPSMGSDAVDVGDGRPADRSARPPV